MKNTFQGLTTPFKYESGSIVDGAGKTIIKAERDSSKTPLAPTGRDAMLQLVVVLLNEAFEYGEVEQILTTLGY